MRNTAVRAAGEALPAVSRRIVLASIASSAALAAPGAARAAIVDPDAVLANLGRELESAYLAFVRARRAHSGPEAQAFEQWRESHVPSRDSNCERLFETLEKAGVIELGRTMEAAWETVERIAVAIRDTPAAEIKGVAVKLLAMEILCKGYEMAMLGEGRANVDRAAADYDLEQMMIVVDQVLELAASEQRSAH